MSSCSSFVPISLALFHFTYIQVEVGAVKYFISA